MAHKLRHYDVAEFNNMKGQQGKNIKIPPRANFLAAVNHLRDFFESKKFAYGFTCGMQMLCLGYKREMPDVHIAYDDRDFNKIKAKLESNQRVRLPDGMNSLFPSKILVRTGPEYRDPGCTETCTIEVDLIPPGSHGTPPMGTLAQNLVLLSYKPDGKLRTYKGLNMVFLLRSLFQYCRSSDLAWDPRKDILFLCQHYSEDVRTVRARLDLKAVQQNFLGTAFFSRLPLDDQHRCYHVLLGKEPPPAMAITPPAPALDGAVPQSEKPQISKYRSSPALNSKTSTPELLNLPLSLPQTGHTAADQQAVELATPPNSISEGTGTHDSRSRYRPISAPGSRTNSPESRQPNAKVRPASMDMRQARQPAISNHNGAPSNVHAQHPAAVVPNSHIAHQRNRSLPSMDMNYRRQAGYHTQEQFQSGPFEVSATPAAINPGQEYLKSQLGLGGDYLLPQMRAENSRPITSNPVPPSTRTAYTVPQQPVRVEPSDSAIPKSQHGSLHGINTVENTNLPIRGEDVERKLRLVGPEGLYGASQTVNRPPTGTAQSLTKAPQSSFVFELDATPSHSSATDLASSINAALSELHDDWPSSDPTRSKTEPQLKLEESMDQMSLKLVDHQPASLREPTLGQQSDRPLNPRIHSAPAMSLPTSLMIGSASTRHHVPPSTPSQNPLLTTTAQITTTQTNASRYSRYYSSPTITPDSTGSSPELKPAPLSVYKAYQPPTVTQSQNVTTDANRSRPTSLEVSKDRWRTHKRDASHDSQLSNASHDSSKLAQEYQAELPGFEQGYGVQGR